MDERIHGDFSVSRAGKSAMWDPMYTMYTVRIGEMNGLRPSMSALWGLLPAKCAFPKGNAWVYGHQVTEVYVSFGKMSDLRPSVSALEGSCSPNARFSLRKAWFWALRVAK